MHVDMSLFVKVRVEQNTSIYMTALDGCLGRIERACHAFDGHLLFFRAAVEQAFVLLMSMPQECTLLYCARTESQLEYNADTLNAHLPHS